MRTDEVFKSQRHEQSTTEQAALLLVVIMNILVGGLNVLGLKPQGRQVR